MPSDRDLVQIVDAAMSQAVRVSGSWIACKIGCTECCMGPFPISQLDAIRLQQGLAELDVRDPGRAGRVRERARRADLEEEEEPCPALDPETGACDVYEWRPITCRTFGPAVRWGSDAVGTCELCYQGATDEQIAACTVDIDPDGLEEDLLRELNSATGQNGQTTVAVALITALPTIADPATLRGHPQS